MKKKRIYLAGKVSGLSRFDVVVKFSDTELELENQGYEVVNPLHVAQKNDDWQTAMRKCIKALMDCDEAYFMSCWPKSPGAILERQLVEELKIPLHKNSF